MEHLSAAVSHARVVVRKPPVRCAAYPFVAGDGDVGYLLTPARGVDDCFEEFEAVPQRLARLRLDDSSALATPSPGGAVALLVRLPGGL